MQKAGSVIKIQDIQTVNITDGLVSTYYERVNDAHFQEMYWAAPEALRDGMTMCNICGKEYPKEEAKCPNENCGPIYISEQQLIETVYSNIQDEAGLKIILNNTQTFNSIG